MKSFSNKNQKGFTILYAMLIAGVLLSIGVSIASISIREIALLASAERSTTAFYVADSGAECALAHDFYGPKYFLADLVTPAPSDFSGFTCGANNEAYPMSAPTYSTESISGVTYRTSTFTMHIDPSSTVIENPSPDTTARCAVVVVKKNTVDGSTIIDSRGFTTCDTSNPKVVERGVRINY